MKCAREPDGSNVDTIGICTASTTYKLNGVHEGKNGGRSCWIIVGTFCKGEVQGSFAKKFKDCRECKFYQYVHNEEGSEIKEHIALLRELF